MKVLGGGPDLGHRRPEVLEVTLEVRLLLNGPFLARGLAQPTGKGIGGSLRIHLSAEEGPGYVVKLGIHSPDIPAGFRQGNRDHLGSPGGDHRAEFAGRGKVGGGYSKAGRQNPVLGCRRAASLQVAEHGDPGFKAGKALELSSDRIGDTTQPFEAKAVDR